MNTHLIRRSAMLFITVVAVILLNIVVASADEPGPTKYPRRPVDYATPTPTPTPTPTATPTPTPTPVRSISPVPNPPTGETRNPPWIRSWVWISCLILLLLLVLLLLVWLSRRRKSQPPSYPLPSKPTGGASYTQTSSAQQSQSQYGSDG